MTRKKLKSWKENNDPIKVEIYNILIYVKILMLIVIIYFFVLTISEITFTIENATDNAFGYYPNTKEKANEISDGQKFRAGNV